MSVKAQKTALRDRLLTARAARSPLMAAAASQRISEHLLASDEVTHATWVAAYVGVGHEPITLPLLDALRGAGRQVILPVLLPGRKLDWASYEGPDSLTPTRLGLLQPSGRTLGVEAISTASVVLVPALAVDRDGTRLGRGGGYYDRALVRVPRDTAVWAVLFDDEVVPSLPSETHDRPVSGVATPSGITRLNRS